MKNDPRSYDRITVYVIGHKFVLGLSQSSYNPRLAAQAKMSLSSAQNIFMPTNINSIVLLCAYFVFGNIFISNGEA